MTLEYVVFSYTQGKVMSISFLFKSAKLTMLLYYTVVEKKNISRNNHTINILPI
jgi:hypothetical protein